MVSSSVTRLPEWSVWCGWRLVGHWWWRWRRVSPAFTSQRRRAAHSTAAQDRWLGEEERATGGLLSSCGLQPNQRARLGHGAQDKTLGDICCHSCTPLSPKQVYEDHFSRSHEVDQCLKSKPFQKKMGSIGMNGRKRQNLRNNNIFLAEGSFIAKTSGNRATADHVMPTGGRCQHRAARTFGDISY